MKEKKRKKEIKNICEKCAVILGKHLAGVASFWTDVCDICDKETEVASIFDFNNNYMKENF